MQQQQKKYLRIFSDEQGESHFEEVEVTLNPVDFAPPAPPLNFVSLFGATRCSLIGGSKDWGGNVLHPAPRRQLMCIVDGVGEIEVSDGEVRELKAGDLFLVEDVTGRGHVSRFTSEEDVVALTIDLAD